MSEDISKRLQELLDGPVPMHATRQDLRDALRELERLRSELEDARLELSSSTDAVKRLEADLAMAVKWRDNYKLAVERATGKAVRGER